MLLRESQAVSAALFLNEQLADVVLALDALSEAHAQAVATRLGIPQPTARAALLRLLDAGVMEELPRPGLRSARVFKPTQSETWRRLVDLSRAIVAADPGR